MPTFKDCVICGAKKSVVSLNIVAACSACIMQLKEDAKEIREEVPDIQACTCNINTYKDCKNPCS